MTDKTTENTTVGGLAEPVVRAVREEIHHEAGLIREELRNELREQTRRRSLRMYGGAAVAALYGGGTFTVFLVLAAGLAVPAWVAALVVTVMLGALAVVLKNAAGRRPRRHHDHHDLLGFHGRPERPRRPVGQR
ncbi:phage holin family protein [Streptomyces sp. NPDC007100]|uniref:phage holin family protein n=1 Tax=unclassified Streptomyces TaxID=2593676 RepID=UPI0033ED4C11